MSKAPSIAIHHVSLLTQDVQKALDFFVNILGLQPLSERPDLGYPGAWLAVGSQQVHLLQLPDPCAHAERPSHPGRDGHLALVVDDLAAVIKKLEAANIPCSHSRSGRQAVFCRDPDGNGIELIQQQ